MVHLLVHQHLVNLTLLLVKADSGRLFTAAEFMRLSTMLHVSVRDRREEGKVKRGAEERPVSPL